MVDLLDPETLHQFPVLSVAVAGDAARRYPFPETGTQRRIVLDMSHRRHCGFWAMQLDDAVRNASEPILVEGEGLACLAIARWAQLSPRRYVENIAGAYLFAPLSFALPQATAAKPLLPSPAIRLPFASLVVESRLSPLVERVLTLADTWGSRFIDRSWTAFDAATAVPAAAPVVEAEDASEADAALSAIVRTLGQR